MSEQTSLPPSTRIIYAVFDYYSKHRRRIMVWTAAAVVVGILASGFYIVKKEELGVVLRFGRVVNANVRPGIRYCIPIIDEVHIRKVKRVTRYRVASKEGNKVNFTILSGDVNLLEVDVAVQYRIDNLRNFLFISSDPIAMLTVYAREELVDALGENFIDLILTSNRNIIQSRLFDRITARLENRDIGIELVSLDIVDVKPIEETIAAFRDVSDAFAERAKAVSDANRQKEQLIARSRGQGEALVLNAKARARERVVQAKSSAGSFSALLGEYRKQPSHVRITRYWDRMRKIFSEASLAAVNPANQSAIDINMIDGAGDGFTPADLALGEPPTGTGAAAGRMALSSTQMPDIHKIENVDEDRLTLDGQFHKVRSERDHLDVANPRSLIFDTPSIFSHSHVVRGKRFSRQEQEKPMVEVLPEEDARSTTQATPGVKSGKKTKAGLKQGKKAKAAVKQEKQDAAAGKPAKTGEGGATSK
ncbi:MAG: protease modulator HflK [Gemmatimonadetes bacterium]|nr:protease modulator HflK [Gemmatimonadota bacterium]